MLSATTLDRLAQDYYLAGTVPDQRIEHRAQLDAMDRVLGHVPPGRVLELGYGDGLVTAALQDRGHRGELVEGSALLCQQARRKHKNLPVHHAMFEHFVPQGRYDTILALHVLEHLDDPVHVLRHIANWLTPGGRIVIVVPNRESLHRRLALRMGLISALDELSARDHLVGHQRVYSLAYLEADAASAGLTVSARFGSFLKLLPNSMMLDFPDTLLTALDGLSDELSPDLLANIGVVLKRERPRSACPGAFPSFDSPRTAGP